MKKRIFIITILSIAMLTACNESGKTNDISKNGQDKKQAEKLEINTKKDSDKEEAKEAKAFLTVEMNILGQMVDDVKLATEGKYPVDHYGSIFEIPETDGIIAKAKEMLKKGEI